MNLAVRLHYGDAVKIVFGLREISHPFVGKAAPKVRIRLTGIDCDCVRKVLDRPLVVVRAEIAVADVVTLVSAA